MLKCSVVFTLLVTALLLVPCPMQAQSQGGSYSGYRPSVGYMPSHMEVPQRAGQPVVTVAEEETTESFSEKDQVVSVAKASRAARGSNRAVNASGRSIVWTAFEGAAGPVEVDNTSISYTQESCESCCGEEIDGCSTMSCRPHCFWGDAEYLGWWKQGMNLPALVTTNPTTTPTLSDANTVILFGDETINKDAKSGGRFTLGMWATPCQSRGIEFTYMNLGTETTSYRASGDDYTILGRPFFNVETATADANLINYPSPVYSGWVNVEAKTKFQGTELLYRRAFKRGPCSQVDFLVGWRWLQLRDDLQISESVTDPLAATIELSDQFNTKNNFHGVEFGVQWQRPISCVWTLEVLGKMALGNNQSVVFIDGRQTSDPDQGLLALDSNSGTHTRNSLAAVTEFGLSLKRRFHCGLEASFGYTFVYWSDVMRAGDQIDLNVDPRQIPPNPQSAAHPEVLMNTTDFWAQGLHAGLEYAF